MPLALLLAIGLFAGAAISMQTAVATGRTVLRESLQRSLANTACLAATAVDPALHARLQRREDETSAAYAEIAGRLHATLGAVPDIRYIYTFRKAGGHVRFVVDATPPGDADGDGVDDHSYLDEVYRDPDPALEEAVARGTSTVTGRTFADKWGTFASAYAPVRRADGSIECFVGVDMDASEYESRLVRMEYAKDAGLGVAALASALMGSVVYGLRRSGLRAQEQARSSLERLERTAYNLPGAIFEFRERADGGSRFLFASNGLRDVLGFDPGQMQGGAASLEAIVHEEDLPRVRAARTTSRTNGTLLHVEYRIRRANGEIRWIEARSIPIPLPDGDTTWYGYVCDITERKRTDLALTRAVRAAEAANRARSEFVAKVSHELRTPLTAIAGYTEILRDGPGACEGEQTISDREAVEAIHRNAAHLLALVNDILDVARIEAGRMNVQRAPTAIRELANDVMDGFRMRVAERRLSLFVQIDRSVPAMVMSDPVRLRQVLTNLVTNAVKFTDRGSVWLTARAEGSEWIAISVRDTGPGMTAAQLEGLFRPFAQIDNSMSRTFGGAGLGLAICKQLAELMGGSIRATSRPGLGSEFTVLIPRVECADGTGGSDALPAPSSRASAPDHEAPGELERRALAGALPQARQSVAGPAPLRGCRILLVEDGADNARLLRHHLRVAGAMVTHVWDGRAAVRLLAGSGDHDEPPFDLVLMDMQMPELDGYTATEQVRTHGCTIPIVALTAHAAEADQERCMAAGCCAYATKPIRKDDLIALCQQWARRPSVAGAAAT
jgi:PAS domain S-box-containing protein